MNQIRKALDQWPITKQVVIGRRTNDTYFVRWRDGWDCEKYEWVPTENEWEYLPPSTFSDDYDDLTLYFMMLFETDLGQPAPEGSMPDVEEVMELVVKDLAVKTDQMTMAAWLTIMQLVVQHTDDAVLQLYVINIMKDVGTQNATKEQKAKREERIAKANVTKKRKSPKPLDIHIATAYRNVVNEMGVPEKGAGEEVKSAFWMKVIRYADEQRSHDFDIDCDPKPWGVKWRRAENKVSELRTAGIIKD